MASRRKLRLRNQLPESLNIHEINNKQTGERVGSNLPVNLTDHAIPGSVSGIYAPVTIDRFYYVVTIGEV